MFIGSLFTVQYKAEMERIPVGSASTIIYVESENKFYEKNRYGLCNEYAFKTIPEPNKGQIKEENNIDVETRLFELEQAFKQLSEQLGGASYAI